jgi:hypothetical protein
MTNDDCSLLLDYLADDLTADELDALLDRLKTEPALAEKLLSMAADEARLVEWARTVAPYERPGVVADAPQSVPRASNPLAAAIKSPRRGLLLLAGSCAVAASLLVVFGLPGGTDDPSNRSAQSAALSASDQETVARIINESGDANWYIESRLSGDTSSLHRGDTVQLTAGSLRILFEHGTSVTLQAPAELEIQDPMLARIHRGSIRVLVAKGAEGFSIATPMAKVVDLGTEFGVRVDDRGGTDVAVFQGAVDVEGRLIEDGAPQLAQRLTAGEAVRVDERGTTSRLVTVESGLFPKGGSGSLEPSANLRPPVIQEVRDNVTRDGNYFFYEIVHAGMREDALAFVDRPEHQWNGVDRSGMPVNLIGGDYVRTFNDDKLSDELAITLQIDCPSTIYLLLDDRARAPDWLINEFEQTTEKIGLDRGIGRVRAPGSDDSPQWTRRPTGIGAGVSVDETFSIWKRTVHQAGEVVLGPLSGHDWDTNMYGIVAVPLDQ